MQASVGGGGSGAAARAAGPDSLPLRERPENACMQRVLREIDGLGFCRSSLAGRRLNPTPENPFEYHESTRIPLHALTFASILPVHDTILLLLPRNNSDMADIFNLRTNPDGQLSALTKGTWYTLLNVQDFSEGSQEHQDWLDAITDSTNSMRVPLLTCR